MENLVSIITPAYHAEATIAEAVKSVLAQTHSQWEMLIVADDHQDYQQILAQQGVRDERLHFYSTNRAQCGPNVARNIALAQIRGDWIAPLDADDIYSPERLARLLEAAKPAGLALDNVRVVGQNVRAYTALNIDATDVFGFSHVKSSLVPLLFLFHSRHVHCGWDEDVSRGADTLFNLRGLESAGCACFLSEALHEYRVHDKSMCHAPGAENIFQEAYAHTIKRLREDGLGFQTPQYREQVARMLEEKRQINQDFARAVEHGYEGNYQSFVQEHQIKG